MSRFVELYDLAAPRNIQSSSRDRDLNEIWVCSLVCYRFTGMEGAVLRGRFHVNVPQSPYDVFDAVRVSKAWPRENYQQRGGKRRF